MLAALETQLVSDSVSGLTLIIVLVLTSICLGR
jgi:hypothetical protein